MCSTDAYTYLFIYLFIFYVLVIHCQSAQGININCYPVKVLHCSSPPVDPPGPSEHLLHLNEASVHHIVFLPQGIIYSSCLDYHPLSSVRLSPLLQCHIVTVLGGGGVKRNQGIKPHPNTHKLPPTLTYKVIHHPSIIAPRSVRKPLVNNEIPLRQKSPVLFHLTQVIAVNSRSRRQTVCSASPETGDDPR